MVDTASLESVLLFMTIPFYIIGFIGNVLVIRIVHKTREMHTTTNYLLANLAVSDAITILLAPLYFFSYILGYISHGFGEFSCKMLVLTFISISASSFTLTLLAVERYHALLKPFRTELRLKDDNVKQTIALTWISGLLLCFPIFFLQEWSETHSTCIGPLSLHMNHLGSKVYVIIFCVLNTCIPFALFVYCYGSLIKGLYFTKTICAADTQEDRCSERKKLVVTFILATTGFFLGFGPIQTFFMVIALDVNDTTGSTLHSNLYTVFCFVFDCSLCLNPILYAFRSRNFQDGFKRIIFCRREPTQQNEVLMDDFVRFRSS